MCKNDDYGKKVCEQKRLKVKGSYILEYKKNKESTITVITLNTVLLSSRLFLWYIACLFSPILGQPQKKIFLVARSLRAFFFLGFFRASKKIIFFLVARASGKKNCDFPYSFESRFAIILSLLCKIIRSKWTVYHFFDSGAVL